MSKKETPRKKYTLVMEEDEIVGVEVNGRAYAQADSIPDEDDRAKMQLLVESWPGYTRTTGKDRDKAPEPISRIVFFVFLGVALLMLAILIISTASVVRLLASEVQAPARVINLINRTNDGGQIYSYPVVEFQLQSGAAQTVTVSTGNWPPAYQVGEPVFVAYNPQKVLDARLISGGGSIGLWTLPLIMGVLFVAFSIAAGFAWWLGRQPV
jgi:hypothetical protein